MIGTMHDLQQLGYFVEGRQIDADTNIRRNIHFNTDHATRDEIKKQKIDLFHSLAYVLPVWLPCPAVVTIHDISYSTHPEWMPPLRTWYTRIMSYLAAHKAWRIITDAQFSRDELEKYYRVPVEKISVISLAGGEEFHGEVSEEDKTRALQKYGIETPFLIAVGAIHQRRNVPRMIQAVQQAQEETGKDIKLVLVGPNHHYPPLDLDAFIEKSAPDGEVIALGWVPNDDLRALYHSATALLYASLYEGFGLPLLEAMHCGAPVIAADATAVPEVVGEAAVLVNPYSIDDMAKAIIRLTGDESLRQELIEKGKMRAAKFSWEKTAQETVKVYQEFRQERGNNGRN